MSSLVINSTLKSYDVYKVLNMQTYFPPYVCDPLLLLLFPYKHKVLSMT